MQKAQNSLHSPPRKGRFRRLRKKWCGPWPHGEPVEPRQAHYEG